LNNRDNRTADNWADFFAGLRRRFVAASSAIATPQLSTGGVQDGTFYQ